MSNKSLFSRFLTNKKVLLIVSLVLSFLFWMLSADNINKTFNNIPIVYSLPESVSEELQVFSASDEYITVTVEGKRVAVESLDLDNFIATVDLSEITEPVLEKSFSVNVNPSGSGGFEIMKFEPSTVSLMIDRPLTKNVELRSEFSYSPEGYYVDNNLPDTIEITGPESIVKNVEYGLISGNVNCDDVTENVTNRYSVTLHKTDSVLSKDELKYIQMNRDLEVTFRYLVLNNDVTFNVINNENITIPSEYISTTPSFISVAMPVGTSDVSKLDIDIGRLSQFENEIYNLTFDLDDILQDGMVNKSGGIEKVSIRLDFSRLDSKAFEVSSSRCKVVNLPNGYKYEMPATFNVMVVGTSAAIEKINPEKINITLDFESVKPSGDNYVDVPVNINLNSKDLCWSYRQSPYISVLLTEA